MIVILENRKMLVDFLGSLHLLLLHLPIGLILLAVLLHWLHTSKRFQSDKATRLLITKLAVLSAVLASISGYLLSISGDYSSGLTANHMWSGFVCTAFSIIFFVSLRNDYKRMAGGSSVLLLVSIFITGHLGGTLTHGEDFLLQAFKGKEKEHTTPNIQIAELSTTKFYGDIIQPIFDARCVQCHGPQKQKGKLRLDEEQFIIKGGKSKRELLAKGNSSGELMRRIELPMSDDEHMPPPRKPQPTADEVEVIRMWLELGSNFDLTLDQVSNPDSVMTLVDRVNQINPSSEQLSHKSTVPSYLPDVILKKPSQEVIEQLISKQVVVLPSGESSSFLEINFVNVPEITDEMWSLMAPLKEHVVRLKLTGLSIKDPHMKSIGEMRHLVRLYLDNTGITDEGLADLQQLPHLQYVNLSNTEVSNRGIHYLEDLPGLRQIIAYQTNVDHSDLQGNVEVITGGFTLRSLATDTIRIPEN